MCGIAGYYASKSAYSKQDLVGMLKVLKHRGPDALGYYNDEIVGLGHARLKVIDLSENANQPMYSHNGRFVIVYNGEIYNFQAIARELNIEWKTRSDTEVLLEAFAQWGVSCVQKFNGMFAFAIYDNQDQKLFLFRDRIGIKPLYYHWDGSNLAFASETKALAQLPIDKSIDMESLSDYLFLEYIPHNRSIFKAVNKLQAGHYLTVNQDGVQMLEYYNILDKLNPIQGTTANFVEEFEEKLKESIELRKVSDVPLGTFLSGGADSSLITAVLQKNSKTQVDSFTVGFDVGSYDESPYASEVSKLLNTNSNLSSITESESIELGSRLSDYYDEPFAAESAIPSMLICKKAREKVTVALSGDGGDELFMGYGYYKWYDRANTLQKIGGNIGRQSFSKLLSGLGLREQRAARVLDYQSSENIWLHIWSQEQYMFMESEIGALLGTNYKHHTLQSEWNRIDQLPISGQEKISLFDIKHYLPNNLLYKMDIASMASSLEVRVPLLDHNLVEFAINLPKDMRIKGSTQKYLLKKSLETYLPKKLVHRKKWGFPAPIKYWLRGEMKFLIEQYLSKRILKRQDIFSPKAVGDLLTEFDNGKDYHYKRIWSLIVFQMWYQKYVDKL